MLKLSIDPSGSCLKAMEKEALAATKTNESVKGRIGLWEVGSRFSLHSHLTFRYGCVIPALRHTIRSKLVCSTCDLEPLVRGMSVRSTGDVDMFVLVLMIFVLRSWLFVFCDSEYVHATRWRNLKEYPSLESI